MEQVVPDSVEVVLPYGDSESLSAAGSHADWQFRANSCYDPDYTFTGAQPSGFDQWAAFYALMKTSKMEMIISVSPTTKPLILNVYSTTNSTIATNESTALAMRGAKQVLCGVYETKTMRIVVNMPDVFGLDREAFGDVTFGSAVGANPAQVVYTTIQIFNQDGSAVVAGVVSVRAKFYCQFFSPVFLGLSLTKKDEVVPAVLPEDKTAAAKPKRTFKQILTEFDLIDN